MTEKTILEKREYQIRILSLLKNTKRKQVTFVELDCGLGKRVLIYLLSKELFPREKILVILQSRSSLEETTIYLKEKWNLSDIGVLSSREHWKARIETLETFRIVLTLPQTLLNTLVRLETIPDFSCLVINEIDLVVRRTASSRLLVYPYPALLEKFRGIWKIGLSATLRDRHVIFNGDKVVKKSELASLIDGMAEDANLIRMEDLVGTDVSKYLQKTVLEAYEIKDKTITELLAQIDLRIAEVRERVLSGIEKDEPDLVETARKEGALDQIVIIPSYVTITMDEYQQFSTKGLDRDNNSFAISPVWEVTGGGTIDQTGNFTPRTPGIWTVYANLSNISGYANITVIEGDDYNNTDTDNDMIPDHWEREHGLNITNSSDADLDFDNDNLTNLEEYLNHTDPFDPDTDNDGYTDGLEVDKGTDPLDDEDYPLEKDNDNDSDNVYYYFFIILFVMVIIILTFLVFFINLKRKKESNDK